MKFRLSHKSSQWLKSRIAMLSMISLFTTGTALLSATTIQAEANSLTPILPAQQSVTRQTAPTRLPSRVKNAVLQAYARQFRVPINKLRVVSFSQESWSDACLGLGKPEEGCGVAMVNGWRVEVGNNAERRFYRTDSTGRALRLEDLNNPGSLPQAVGQKVIAIALLRKADRGVSGEARSPATLTKGYPQS